MNAPPVARELIRVDHVGETVALACTPDGRLVGVNNVDGRVRFYAVETSEALPLELSVAEARGVLLHPDGRVISFRYGADSLLIDIHEPRTSALLGSFALGPIERDEVDYDDCEKPSVDEGYYYDVAILASRPLLDWLLPVGIANASQRERASWELARIDDYAGADIYPNRFTRMALHPNRRWLAVLDRATWVIDLESKELLRALHYELPWMLEDSGTHTVGFHDEGRLSIASTVISGNPFVEVDRVDVESGFCMATIEVWRQLHRSRADAPAIEINSHDPTSLFPPEQIPAGSYKVLFRRCGIELWSSSGLVRGVPLEPRTYVIPASDPASFCSEARALLVTDEHIELLDLLTGERSPVQPPIGEPRKTARLSYIGFDASRRRVLIWREGSALLAAPIGSDHWSVSELPQGRRMRDWTFACEPGRAFVVDDAGDLWLVDVDVEPRSSARSGPALHALERDLLAHPHEPAPFLIYADALNDRGDLRGQLIVLQHQRAFNEANSLLAHNRRALLGPLAELAPDSFDLRWERGFVRIAKFTIAAHELHPVMAFLASDGARLLESLELHVAGDDALASYARIDAYLAAARHLPHLSSLRLGEQLR